MSRRRHLDAFAAAADVAWPQRRGRVVLLTGQSRLDRSPLSPDQHAFLAEITPPSFDAVRAGAPYVEQPVETPPGLASASFANARQYVWARCDPLYGRLIAGALAPVLAASDAVLLVVASAGLLLLQAAWPHLGRPGRMAVLCLGPAGAPAVFEDRVVVKVMRGDRDLWSRALYQGSAISVAGCGHMGYWRHPKVRAAARAFAAQLADTVA